MSPTDTPTPILWAARQRLGSPTAKALLVTIAEHVERDGHCEANQQQLAVESEISAKSVGRYLAAFEKRGIITRKWQQHAKRGRSADLITLVMDGDQS